MIRKILGIRNFGNPLAFAVMVWVLSGVVGGGWFWGAEGLGLRGCG